MIVFTLETINNAVETFNLFSYWEYINVLISISDVESMLLKLITYIVTKSVKLQYT